MMKKTTQSIIQEGSGSSGQKPVRTFFKKGLKAAGKGLLYLGTGIFLTWIALTSTASTVTAQTKSITQKIEVLEENAKINLKNIQNVEIKDGYLYLKSDGKDFRVDFVDPLGKIGAIDSIKVDDNWVVAFGKKGIMDIVLDAAGAKGQFVFSIETNMTAYYYDKKNRTSIAADENGLMMIHPMGRVTMSFAKIGELLKKEIKTSSNVNIDTDPDNENYAIISFDGVSTLRILNDVRDKNGEIIKHVTENLGSGN